MVGLSDAKVQWQNAYLRMEELASGFNCNAHHSFHMVTDCHTSFYCPFSIVDSSCTSFSFLYHNGL
jgi:hypothetical protein